VFSSVREGALNLYSKPSNGATNEEVLLKSNEGKIALDWSHDGKYLLYDVNDPKTKADLWYLPMKEGDRKPVRYLATEFNEGQARFSPDGRFVAYTSDESGAAEIYVRTFPDPSGKWQVSKNGGAYPRWRRDGKELFYLAGGTRIMAVDVTTGATFQSGEPKVLLDARVPAGYDVTADGKRFLIATSSGDGAADPITVVLNWQAGLKK
jgi:eukaryotic-like serine/threonine-protein kinase